MYYIYNMRVRFILLTVFLGLVSTTKAQKKDFTMQEAVLGLGSSLSVKNLKQCQWMGNTSLFSHIVSNDTENVILACNPANLESEVAVSLEKMNKELLAANEKPLKSFPSINWIDKDHFYFENDGKTIQYNITDASKISYLPAAPKDADNVIRHPSTMEIAYTENHNLFVKRKDNTITQITRDGSANLLYGTSVHRDEFGIDHGIFWSPKGNHVAFYKMDQSMVEDYAIVNWNEVPAKSNPIKYPFAGRKSHEVSIGVFNVQNNSIVFLQTGTPLDQYLTCVSWSPDEKYVYVTVLNRDQNHAKLNQYDASTGSYIKTVLEEKHPKYVEPQHDLFFPTENSNECVYWSQRDGFMHLYLLNLNTGALRSITKGNWLVNELIGYNPKSKELIITGTKDSPLEKNIYSVNMYTGAMKRLNIDGGVHNASLSKDGAYILDLYSNAKTPRAIEVMSTQNAKSKRVFTASNPLESYNICSVRNVELIAADASTKLYGKLLLPHNFDSNKKYPVLVYLYNGPHLQLIKNSFPESGNLWYDYLTQRGYLVFVMDGRGSSNRGLEFENATFRQLGTEEMKDQLQGVSYLKKLPFVDPTKMAVHGWSYGGFMTTSLMVRHPDVFKVGIAGGPVLDWSMYEIMYTERYMDTPETNKQGFDDSELFSKVKNLKGKLLMIHGTDDPVVVWQHSLKFVKKCVDENVQLDYFVYPGHEHNVRGKNRVHLMQKITDYLDANLK